MTSFKGLNNIGDPSISEVLRDNIVSWVDWALLDKGNFISIYIPTSGSYGGARHILRPVSDPRYLDGRVWEAYRASWVWESGLATSTQPVQISGVFVGNTYYPTSSGFIINYPEGRIIFDTAISTSSTVKLEYSHKWVKVLAARDIPWFQEGFTRSFRVDSSSYLPGSGIWNQLSQTRVELPVIAVEVLDNRNYKPYQLGRSMYAYTDVVFHILTEDDSMAYRLTDILANQEEKSTYLYSPKRIADANRFPLNHYGSKSSNPLTYPDLIKSTGDGGYMYDDEVFQGKMLVEETSARFQGKISHRLYHSSVKWRTSVVLNNV